jgi:hypothetical protein
MPIERFSDHRMEPVQSTVRRARDGEPADLLNPLDYPVVARCRGCGQRIRDPRMMFSSWYHAEDDHAEGNEQ